MKFFKNTMAELTAVHETLEWLEEQALELGIPASSVTITNSRQKLDRIVREWRRAEEQAEAMGYASLAVALKALSQIKDKGSADITKLPTAFHNPPMIWLTGKPPSKIAEGFAPMRPRDAERQHRRVLPLLIEAWELAGEDEVTREKIESGYRTWSADDFERELFTFIYELEEPTLEEQFAEEQSQKALQLTEWEETNARARAAAKASRKRVK